MSTNKDKGTKAETAVVNLARTMHWPYAERRALGGGKRSIDRGDIAGIISVTIQVKNIQDQGPKSIAKCRDDTVIQMLNNKDEFCILVVKPRGVGFPNVDAWEAHIPLAFLLRDNPYLEAAMVDVWTVMNLKDAFNLIHEMGY